MSDEDAAPGWDAINAALAPIYGDQEPKHYGTVLPAMLGGNDPLHGISVYHREGPVPHFHYVTYGFSNLFGEEQESNEYSGFGFELTFRLASTNGADDPPNWPLNFLQNIARYVFKSGNFFEVGHHVDLNGPIALEEVTEICCIAFAVDPELPAIHTPSGRVEFLQIVGLCRDEWEAAKAWNTRGVLDCLSRFSPLLITDIHRASILHNQSVAEKIRASTQRDGSKQDAAFAMVAQHDRQDGMIRVRISANAVDDVKSMIDGKLLGGEPFSVFGKGQTIRFEPSEQCRCREVKQTLVIETTPALAREMSGTLKTKRGTYQWSAISDLVLEVVPTEIKDQDGNVLRTVG